MTDRCEPPPELRGVDGWHWVEAPSIKMIFVRRWWRARGEWCWADMDERTLRSFRYHSPVATPAEVAALRTERDAAVENAAMYFRVGSEELAAMTAERNALRAGLQRCEDACFDVQRDNATLRARVAVTAEPMSEHDWDKLAAWAEAAAARVANPQSAEVLRQQAAALRHGAQLAATVAAWNLRALPIPDAPASAWQPIETAPRDGTRIFLAGCARGPSVRVGWWGTGRFLGAKRGYEPTWAASSSDYDFGPTHWQPLPQPPVDDHG